MSIRETISAMFRAVVVTAACLTATVCRPAAAQCYHRAPIRDGDHVIQRRVCSYMELKRRNIVMQKKDFSCGAAALATVVRYFWGDEASEELYLEHLARMLTIDEARDRVENGLTMTDLRRVAVKTGYQASVGKLEFSKLVKSRVPLVVGLTVDGIDHFVVYRGHDGYYVYLADPIRGNIRVPAFEFVCQWQKNAVLVVAKPNQTPPKTSPLTVCKREVCLGRLNSEYVRKQMTRTAGRAP